jgi:predicted aspartyl protease
MTQPSVIERAKQGDPEAIATLLNHALQPKGITATVHRWGDCLRIMLETEQIPGQQATVQYMQKSMSKLGVETIKTVQLYIKHRFATVPAWSQRFELETLPVSLSPLEPKYSTQPSSSSVQFSPTQSIRTTPIAENTQHTSPTVVKFKRSQQAFFSVTIALLLVLVGANIRSVFNLLEKSWTPAKVSITGDGISEIPIIGREGGTPIINVTFNGNEVFPMILDTGASGTLITQSMATTLGVAPVSQATFATANGYVMLDVGFVSSIEIGDARINNASVAIATSDLEVGLLGHDFFGSFDIMIREEVVEFRPR